MEKLTFQAKDGWLRIKFILGVENGKVREVEYTAARCKTLRSLADTLRDALIGLDVDRVKDVVRETLSGIDLPENRENRRRLLLKAFGVGDGRQVHP